MDKWMGPEARLFDHPSGRALKEAEAASRAGDGRRAIFLADKAIKLDQCNLDAYLVQTLYTAGEARAATHVKVAKLGKDSLLKKFGPKAFGDDGGYVGKFWNLLETRPYIRVLNTQRELYGMEGKWDLAATAGLEMLRLCPGDNMSVRDYLPSYLCHVGRYLHALNFITNWITPTPGTIPSRGGTLLTSRALADFDPTLTTKGGLKLKKAIERSPMAEMLYTGAKAAYESWGDCKMARIFWRSGTKVNFHIARYLIAQVPQPTDFDRNPRMFNGPEAAHDYLYVAQPFWYSNPACYTWATSDPVVANLAARACSNPACTNKEDEAGAFQRCSACKETSYCSRRCSKEHWKLASALGGHKEKCQIAQQMQTLLANRDKPQEDENLNVFFEDQLNKATTE